MSLLSQVVGGLESGKIKIVDLTQPLGPATPVIGLPPQFGASPGVTMEVISHFDEKGPGWYWNVIHMGEHTGTHFDAPIHWITGKDLKEMRIFSSCRSMSPRGSRNTARFRVVRGCCCALGGASAPIPHRFST